MRARRVFFCLAMVSTLAAAVLFGTAVASSGTGYDISYPQCNAAFPASAGFGIVGVNDGLPFSANPCLGAGSGPSELQWAGMSAGLYANTADPGAALSTHWPNGQSTPQQCDTTANPGSNTAQCAYDYGWNAAADSYQDAVNAYIALGWATAGATRTPVANQWWLDVESANSWGTNTAFNVDELQGEADYLASVGAASVGFYSTASDWQTITGGTATFSAYRSWVPGAGSLSQAQAECAGSGFTGGGVALTQYPSGGFDGDYQCATASASLSFSSAPQSSTAGGSSGAITVAIPQASSTATSVSVTSSFGTGTFATNQGGPYGAPASLTIPAGSTTATFYYSDTRAGQPVLTASATGYAGATQTETVTAAPLATLAVTPGSATVRVGARTSFSATGRDRYGNAVPVTPTWSVSPALGTFSPNPANPVSFTARSAGTGTITASAAGITATASITATNKHQQGAAARKPAAAPSALIGPASSRPPTLLPARPGG